MACDMPARGEQATLVTVDGSKSVYDLIKETADMLPEGSYWKIEATLEFEDGLISLIADGGPDGFLALCLETGEGETVKGDDALKLLEKYWNRTPTRGFLEAQILSEAGIELDLQSSPETKLSNPLNLSRVQNVEEKSGEAVVERVREGSESEEAASSVSESAGTSVRVEVNEAEARLWDKMTRGETLTMEEVTRVLTDLILFSITMRFSRDYKSLILEAVEKSKGDVKSFYRVHIERRDGVIVDLFIYRGRVCSALTLDPEKGVAEWYTGDVDKLEQSIDEVGVESARLDMVRCDRCMRVFVEPCLAEAGGEEKRVEEREEHREEKRGGLLSRLFRRRR